MTGFDDINLKSSIDNESGYQSIYEQFKFHAQLS